MNAVEDIDANLKMSLKINYSQVDLKEDMIYEEMRKSAQLVAWKNRSMSKSELKNKTTEPKGEDIYTKYLEIIQRHILKKQKKDLFINVEKRVKLIAPFLITTENYQNCMKAIVLIRVRFLYYMLFYHLLIC